MLAAIFVIPKLKEYPPMSREELQQKSRFAMIGTLMTIVSLVFLFYVGSSLVNTTKKYKELAIEIACINK